MKLLIADRISYLKSMRYPTVTVRVLSEIYTWLLLILKDGETPIFIAIRGHNDRIVQFLISKGADLNSFNKVWLLGMVLLL